MLPTYQVLPLVLTFLLTFTPVPPVTAYCWEAGRNPTFTEAPLVEQVDIRTVRVSWHGRIDMRECADQFLVKYWQKNNPQDYQLTPLMHNNLSSVLIEIVPRVEYTFQAIAREDKGQVLGIEYNKSPKTHFKTSAYNEEVQPSPAEVNPTVSVYNNPPKGETNPNPEVVKGEEVSASTGPFGRLSLEVIAIIVVCSVVVLLIVVGLVYKLACAKKSDEDEDSDDDDDDEDDEKEKFEA